jgi:hypothetical protein
MHGGGGGVKKWKTKIPHCRNRSKIKQKQSWKEVKSTPLTHKYMIAHFPSLIPAYQYKSGGVYYIDSRNMK